MTGEPCFKGTRVPVETLIDHIEGNSTLDDFLRSFPTVTREQVIRIDLVILFEKLRMGVLVARVPSNAIVAYQPIFTDLLKAATG